MKTMTFWRVLVGTVVLSTADAGHASAPDGTLYVHASVFTGRADRPDATWFVVKDEKIADIGDGTPPARWSELRHVDLGGRFVSPGFVDAHVHFVEGGLSLLEGDLSAATTEDDAARAVRAAAEHPIDGWVVVRNLSLAIFGGALPTHAAMTKLAAATGGKPLLVKLAGGHHVYLDPRGLEELGMDDNSEAPKGGTLVRDGKGALTGLLIDDAAWDAVRRVEERLQPSTVAAAILAAQRRALRYGITSIGDNTFFPAHMAQYARLAKKDALKIRVSARSFGPEPATKLTMRGQGTGLTGPGPFVRYFGEKFFVDGSLANAGAKLRADDGDAPRYDERELRDLMLFAGPFGTAYHTQSREGAERLVRARTPIVTRRAGALPDVIDHCGHCAGDLPARIRAAGFKVTILPGQLHDLPELLELEPAETRDTLLPLRGIFDAALEPAVTSDWPFGAEHTYGDAAHYGLAPLANVAVLATGKRPDGAAIEGASTRTVSLGQALLGVTRNGAAAIGRDDVGRMVPGAWADFLVFSRSPFEGDATSLYTLDPVTTYVAGEPVSGEGAPVVDDVAVAAELSSKPRGGALSPIVGYDPVQGFIFGAAYFFYPYEARGPRGSVQLLMSPAQLRGRVEAEVIAMHAFGVASPRLFVAADTLRDRYYGVGMHTDPDRYVKMEPTRFDISLGMIFRLSRRVDLGVHAIGAYLRENTVAEMTDLAGGAEGGVQGAQAGGRLELAWDDRDNEFSTRKGGRMSLWTESYGLAAGHRSFLQRAGASISRFFALRAPDWVLAMRAEAATSIGTHSFGTDYALGGGYVLRGYYTNRFRGHHVADATAEVRFPIVGPLSGAVFGEVGRVWLDHDASGRVAPSGGAGIRYGLPPDRLVRLRLDFGVAPDQWGIFFKFNEAF